MNTETVKLKKVNPVYLALSIFLPIIVSIGGTVAAMIFIDNTGVGSLIATALLLAAVFWWGMGISAVYKKKAKKLFQAEEEKGFRATHIFTGNNCALAVAPQQKELALVFRWNPSECQRVPMSAVQSTWVDDGKGGKGILEGTSRVSFLLRIDGKKLRVDTFISNRRYTMTSPMVKEALEKADTMVEAIRSASGNA